MSNIVSQITGPVPQYLNCGAGVSLDISGPMSISIRCKIPVGDPAGYNSSSFLIVKDPTTYRYGIFLSGGIALYIRLTINGVKIAQWTGNPRDGLWHHIVGTFDGRYVRIYRDGNLIQTTDAGSADTITTGPGSLLTTGTVNWGGYITTQFSEIQVHNVCLSDSDVLYNNAHPNNPKRRGLVLNLTQDSIYGPTWLDLSGNANNGTYVGGAVPVSSNRLAGR